MNGLKTERRMAATCQLSIRSALVSQSLVRKTKTALYSNRQSPESGC
jgi:hypothetical protein